jgi:hypothetical protein
MVCRVILLIFALGISGCGVALPYLYDAAALEDRLSVSMPKEEVIKKLGRPSRIIQDDAGLAVWEYRLYSKGEWIGYLIHCPFYLNCYFPAEPPIPYYVALQQNKLCMWGAPSVVRTLASKVCSDGHAPSLAAISPPQTNLKVSVVPVFMPPPISTPIYRLAVVPLTGSADDRFTSWLDLTLNFLRSRHPQLVLVEREDLAAILDEVGIQYTGRVNDETTVRVGKLVGADGLLTYRLSTTSGAEPISASLELRVLKVETGTTLFRQITTVTAASSQRMGASKETFDSLARRVVIEEAAAYGLAALQAAFHDNPLGVIPDHTWPREGVKVMGLLHGSPGYHAGLKQGDWILNCNGRPVRNWTEPISLPAQLGIERDGEHLELTVEG